MSDGNKIENHLSRRKMLTTALAGTAVGIAGCSGTGNTGSNGSSGGSGGNGSGSSGGSGGGEAVVDLNISWLPGDANWNHRSSGPLAGFWSFDYTAREYWNGTTDWWLLEEDGYSYDPDTRTATYEFRPEYGYWWNGDPVTAEDLQIQREIDRLIDPEGSPWESWTVEGDYTLRGTRKEQINPVLLSPNVDRAFEYRGAWRRWLEQLSEDTTASARESTFEDLANWQISTQQFADEGLGNATYRLTDWNTTELTWELFDQHPYADQVPFETVRWHVGTGSAANQQVTNDVLDIGTGQFEQELRQRSPEYLQTIYTKRSIQVRNLLFNYNNKHIGRRNVRRALISVLDFTRLVDFWDGQGGPVKQRQTGLPQALEDRWLGDELMNRMINYPLQADANQADQFMQQAGYSKQGGTWTGPDGDPLQFNFMIGTYLTQEQLGRAITQTWNQWGADVTLLPVSDTQWDGRVFDPQGEWDVTIWLHGFDELHPMNYFDYSNPYNMRLQTESGGVRQWLENGETHSPVNGKPLTPTIPSSPGLEVGNDGGQQVNIVELVEELRTTQSEERSREIIQTLSRYFNYDLPMFDMFPQVAGIWGDTQNFQWPDDTDIWYQKGSRAVYATLRTGVLKPV